MSGGRLRRVRFAGGVLLGLMAEQLILFSVPLLIFQDSGEVSMLGLAYALEWLPALLVYPFAGLIADRDGGTRLFSRANTARGLLLGSAVVLCLLVPSWTIGVLMANGALLALLVAPVRMSIEKTVPQLATEEELPRTQALFQNMELLAMALGPGLAVVAVMVVGKIWLLSIAAVMFLAAAACWRKLPRGTRTPGAGTVRGNLGELALGWKLLLGNRPVVLLAGLNFSINLVFATMLGANAAVVTDVFHAPESSFALLNMLVGITGLANLLITPRLLKRFGVGLLGVVGYTALCVCLLILGLAPSFLVYAPAFVIALCGVAYFNVFNRTERVKVIPQQHLGKVMGPFFLIGLLSYPIGGVLISTVGASIGPQRLVAGLAVLLSLFGAVVLPLTIRSFRRAFAAKAAAEAEAEAAAAPTPAPGPDAVQAV
ncbi:MFS transporter [Streptomyces sp. NPDC058662]|uniref:MFS transporter n=1 Tax=Streptomyces sp. NPDC058662 TaxID=3346583 RepID=UPI0036609455